ncbi:ChaC-domain-containing protein [Violaceomyces palustris]|uniref:ChaC-domain-containing protein n=1 Tax=Violaceomyces palustris TaxID=1673888 RepID=A0ACD0NLT1_9BASI|nr:ChaC-domain-containing protein [Violaceomyces palustris]
MGASQSAGRSDADSEQHAIDGSSDSFVDYYTLLNLEQDATTDEIRKSYRKLALRHHPDKNPDNVEQANKIFHKLQQAYEILSDDNERAWYDRNRDRILSGHDLDGDGEQAQDFESDQQFHDFRTGNVKPPKPTSSSAGLTTRHLLRFFDPSFASDLSDSDKGFFSTYRRLFERLEHEDRIASPYPGEEASFNFSDPDEPMPSFGYSHTPYSADQVEVNQTPVKDFYTAWINFQSKKSFGWFDKYDTREANDRRVKRMMEKENKRSRDLARREYNDTIRSLAAFVRKRDPRYKKWLEKQTESGPGSKVDIERKRLEALQRQKEREESAKSFKAQSWQMTEEIRLSDDDEYTDESEGGEGVERESYDDDDDAADVGEAGNDKEGAGDEVEGELQADAWDCVACDKFFRSEAAFRNHERSAKHKKAVQALKKQMQEENAELGLGSEEILDATFHGAEANRTSPPPEKSASPKLPITEDVRAMGLEDYADEALDGIEDEDLEISAGFSIPQRSNQPSSAKSDGVGKSKKQKKKSKKSKTSDLGFDEDGYFVETLSKHKAGRGRDPLEDETDPEGKGLRNGKLGVSTCFSTGTTTPSNPPTLPGPLLGPERPKGSFDVFGYGSLIFKPPPHVIGATPGYIKGFYRRFAQHSVDHRGTPSRPGRVVTLISSDDWQQFSNEGDEDEGLTGEDIVWGVSYTIDPDHAEEVREYLDYREKNGYTPTSVDIWGVRPGAPSHSDCDHEVLVEKALVYVGLPSNEAFVGSSPLPDLAERIYTCEGPSGRNDEYLLNLAEAIRGLAPQSADKYLFELERLVLELQEEDQGGTRREGILVSVREEIETIREMERKKEGWKQRTKAASLQSSAAVSLTVDEDGDSTSASNKKSDGAAASSSAKKSRRRKEKGNGSSSTSAKDPGMSCNVCSEDFASRTKLFNHIRETGHALHPDYVKRNVGLTREEIREMEDLKREKEMEEEFGRKKKGKGSKRR